MRIDGYVQIRLVGRERRRAYWTSTFLMSPMTASAPLDTLRSWLQTEHEALLAPALGGLSKPAREALSRRYRRLLLAHLEATPAPLQGGSEQRALQRLALTPSEALELDLRRNALDQSLQPALAAPLQAWRRRVQAGSANGAALSAAALSAAALSPDALLRCFVEALQELPLTLDARLARLETHAATLAERLPALLATALGLVPLAEAPASTDLAIDPRLSALLERIAARGGADAGLAARLLAEAPESPAIAQRLALLGRIVEGLAELPDEALFALVKLALADPDFLASPAHPVRLSLHRPRELEQLLGRLSLGAGFVALGLPQLPMLASERIAGTLDQLQTLRREQRDARLGEARRRVADEITRIGVVYALPSSGQRFLQDVWAPLLTRAWLQQNGTGDEWNEAIATLEPVLATLADRQNARVRDLEAQLNRMAEVLFRAGLQRARIDEALQFLREAYDELRSLPGTASAGAQASANAPGKPEFPGVSRIELPDS